jgi:putative membrane protein
MLSGWRVQGTGLVAVLPSTLAFTAIAEAVVRARAPLALDGWNLTPTPFQLIGVALSIFLGFRNSACYDRWWEGRKLWGSAVNTSRTLARQWLTLLRPARAALTEPPPPDPALTAWQREAVLEGIGFVYALKFRLRTEVELDVAVPFLPPSLLPELRHRNAPSAVLHDLGRHLRVALDRGWIEPVHAPLIDQSLSQLTDVLGACERIKNTPVPLIYTAMTHRIVMLYCLLLPFGILTSVGELTPLVVALVAFCFLGLDEVGNQLEDPFETDPNDLPLATIARAIEIDLLHHLGDTQVPPPLAPVDGVLL